MRIKTLFIALLMLVTTNGRSQSFGTFSGTVRIGGGLYGTFYSFFTPSLMAVMQSLKFTNFDANRYLNEQHTFLRFFNIGGDVLVPNWSMTASKGNIELYRGDDSNFLNDPVNQYTYYVGYYFNWKSTFSRMGFYFGVDYEWKNFDIHYPYPNVSHNKIHALVPAAGLRYRLLSPMKEVEGFPFNIVLEGGVSFVINTKYVNFDGYGLDALNNGIRPMLGMAITTNRFGSIHVRWTKDLFQLFDKDYMATRGFLYNNEITNSFSCFSIGWAIFI